MVSRDCHGSSLRATTEAEKQFLRLEMIEVRVSAAIYSKHTPVE